MKSKKNISLFIASLAFGGTERVVNLLSNELSKHYNITLILLYEKIDFKVENNVKVIILDKKEIFPKSSTLKKIKDFIKFLYRYNRVIKNEKIDVAFSFLGRQNIMNSIVKIGNPKLKTVISERCFPSLMYNSSKTKLFLYKNIYPIFYNRNNALFSNSIYINEDLRDSFNLKIPASVIYNPISKKILQKQYLPYQNKNQEFRITSVGRLTRVKNQKSIIEAISLLASDYKLNIYGDGELRQELTGLISDLNLENQTYLRGMESDIPGKLKEHHCFVLSSLTEGFPNAILEAMASGTPVISTNCKSGPLELLNDNSPIDIPMESFSKAKYGILVNVDDPIGLSKAIEFYRNNEEIRKKYSELAFEKAKTFDINNITKEIKTLIESLN